jgi:hypothetical protein
VIYALIIAVVLFFSYAAVENRLILMVRREKLGNDIRIVHISDLHKRKFGRDNKRLCELVKKQSPDVIFVTGDLITRNMTDFSVAKHTLDELCSTAPVYIIFGNHEQSLKPYAKEKFIKMVKSSGAVLLRNEYKEMIIGGKRLFLAGLEEKYETYKKNGGYRDLEKLTVDDVENCLGKCPEGEVVLLAHNPLFGDVYAEWGADLVFSGHVHGGSVRLFGIGMLSPERKLFPKYSKGIYNIGKTKLLVSAGLGKPRLFDPPEIVVYEI